MGRYTHISSAKSTAQQRGTNATAAASRPIALGQRLGNQGFGELLRSRQLQAENVLRLTSTGEIVTAERLIQWAMNGDRPVAHLVNEIESSHRFSGSAEVRKRTAEALRKADEMFSLEQLRAAQRARAKANRLAADERAPRLRWLAGYGAISDGANVLRRANSPLLLPGGLVQFQTYDHEGVPIDTVYATVNDYRNSIREQLRKIGSNGEDLAHDVDVHVANDAKAVAETLEEAAIYQLPALLLLPGVKLGYSEEALEHGRTAVAYALRAHHEAHAALLDLERNRDMRAGERLNEASVLLLQARHSLQAMLRTREADEEASLGHLQSYSTAGDVATIPMSPWVGAAMAIVKNAATRMAWMHSNPNVEFGYASFAWQSAITLATVWLGGRLTGSNPGFARAVGVGVATNQATKVAMTGDASQILEFSGTEALFVIGGAAYGSAQAHFGKPSIPYIGEPQAFTPTSGLGSDTTASASGTARDVSSTGAGATPVVASNKPGFVTQPGEESAASRGPRDYVKVTGFGRTDLSQVPDTPHEDTVVEGYWRPDDSTPKQSAAETRTPRKIGFKPDADEAPAESPVPVPKTQPGTSLRVHKPAFGTPVTVVSGNRPVASAGNERTGDSPKASAAEPEQITSATGHGQHGTHLQRVGVRAVVQKAVADARRAVFALIPNGMGRPPDFPGLPALDRGPSEPFNELSLHLDPDAIAGACGYARQQVAKSLLDSGVPSEHIYVNQAFEISPLSKAGHAFVVYDSPEGVFLIDTTFGQFAWPKHPNAEALVNTPDGSRLRSDLLADGYVLLTDKIADWYLGVISGTGETPVVGAADFMRPGANLAKHPGREDIY